MRLKFISILILSVMLMGVSAQQNEPKGFYVRDGQLMYKGEPYRAMGINYNNCFTALLKNENNRDFMKGFRILKRQYGIPYIRFMACSFDHTGWKLYLDDKDEYFRRMDMLVKAAEREQIGLIPSMFWYVVTVPDLMDEPLSKLGDKNSRSREFIRKYTSEMVSRYKGSPAVFGWELGNEYMLFADLPKYDHLPPGKVGSDKPRTKEDKILRSMLLDLYKDLYKTIRELDPDRIIVTGDSIARAHAWHNHNEDRWALDTREQWLARFMKDTPDCYNVVSFHLYEEADGNYFKDENLSLEEFVKAVVDHCRANEKLVWCGELGMPGKDRKAEEIFYRMMNAVESNEISLSAIWNFLPAGKYQPDWDIIPGGERTYMLDAVKELNERFAIGKWNDEKSAKLQEQVSDSK